MHPLRILAIATAIEICLASALFALLGLCGAGNGWLDLVNCAAPAIGLAGATGALAARAALDRGRLRAVCVALGAAAALYAGFMLAPSLTGLWPHPAIDRPSYRVVSANLFRDNVSPLHAATAVTSRGADALLLQETDSVGFTLRSKTVLESRYPYASTCPGSSVQIRVKVPLLAEGCGLNFNRAGFRSWGADFVWVRVPGPNGRPVVLATAHLERPYPPARQALQRRVLAEALQGLPKGDPIILAGDFNTVPWSFGMWAQDRLFAPLRRRTHLQFTYPAQLNLTFQPWSLPVLPIDHLYLSARWARARIVPFRTPGSDHFGLQADLALGS
jgi:endonuclease/exonuclease/phosphatase (EEP) superfamily protein YafD